MTTSSSSAGSGRTRKPAETKTGSSGAPAKARRRTTSVAAGAARASGERARRTATPLLSRDASTPERAGSSSAPGGRAAPKTAAPPKVQAPRKVQASAATVALAAKSGPAQSRPPLHLVREEAPHVRPTAPDFSALVDLAQAGAGTLAAALGIPRAEAELRVAEALAFLRRRLTGDYVVDVYGYDADFADHVLLPVLRPIFQSWFRTEVRGVENIPSTGGALVVANHSGTVAIDSLMTTVAIRERHPDRRALRELGADLVFGTPGLATLARKGGATLATNADADRLLADGHLVGVWPEGFKGVGKPFSERYKLQRFGRGGFVAAAVRAGSPIVPCSIVGAEEIYPMLANLKPVARLLGLPYFPVTPLFPHLGPLGLIPLPSKWIIEFGAPIETSHLGPEAADDPLLIFELTDRVRETVQQTIYSLLARRRSVFF